VANQRLFTRFVKWTAVTLAVCCVVVALPFAGLALWAHWPFNWPSDAKVADLFQKHRSEFSELIAMVREDHEMRSIHPDWLRSKSGAEQDGHWSTASGITRDRWDEYKKRFSALGLKYGLDVNEDGSISFNIACIGTLIIAPASYKDLVYKPEAIPWGRGTIVVPSLENADLPKIDSHVSPGYYAKKIEDNWYITRLETD
jgi:hypothetical protein